MRHLIALGAVAIAAAHVAAACGGAEPAPTDTAPAEPTTAETSPPATGTADSVAPESPGTQPAPIDLPAPVAETRDAIVAAAHARDYEALGALLDPATFSYSFGESGDPIGYWRTLEEEGEVPILGDILPTVLDWPAAMDGDIYVWPSAHAKPPENWTEADLEPLRQLYTAEEIAGFEQAGGYLGYRVGIREDGTWLYFVAGD